MRTEVVEVKGAKYQILTFLDYLKVYKKSSIDGYRRTKNKSKDLCKIEILDNLVLAGESKNVSNVIEYEKILITGGQNET